jgi:hypothetical protein
MTPQFDPDQFSDFPSGRKPFKVTVVRVVLFVLGRSLQSLSKNDREIQAEVAAWPAGLTLMMRVLPDCGAMAVQKAEGGRLRYLGARLPEDRADIVIYIQNIEAGFRLLTGQVGTDVAYARHNIAARGDISLTVSLTRVLNRVETYLFPAFIARGLMKRLPEIPFFRKNLLRLKAYFLAIPFGI